MRKLAKLGLWCLSGLVMSWLLVNTSPAQGTVTSTTREPAVTYLEDRAIAQERTPLGIPQNLDPSTLPDFPSRDFTGQFQRPG
ncbi:MAG: hypothetical protein F6K00_03280 [Leptolyngbya sp. SIOISBB]|nr:hypothetical protein [Leptolyngbya sp. SIOISBB]